MLPLKSKANKLPESRCKLGTIWAWNMGSRNPEAEKKGNKWREKVPREKYNASEHRAGNAAWISAPIVQERRVVEDSFVDNL